jgi:hypothetical protein
MFCSPSHLIDGMYKKIRYGVTRKIPVLVGYQKSVQQMVTNRNANYLFKGYNLSENRDRTGSSPPTNELVAVVPMLALYQYWYLVPVPFSTGVDTTERFEVMIVC